MKYCETLQQMVLPKEDFPYYPHRKTLRSFLEHCETHLTYNLHHSGDVLTYQGVLTLLAYYNIQLPPPSLRQSIQHQLPLDAPLTGVPRHMMQSIRVLASENRFRVEFEDVTEQTMTVIKRKLKTRQHADTLKGFLTPVPEEYLEAQGLSGFQYEDTLTLSKYMAALLANGKQKEVEDQLIRTLPDLSKVELLPPLHAATYQGNSSHPDFRRVRRLSPLRSIPLSGRWGLKLAFNNHIPMEIPVFYGEHGVYLHAEHLPEANTLQSSNPHLRKGHFIQHTEAQVWALSQNNVGLYLYLEYEASKELALTTYPREVMPLAYKKKLRHKLPDVKWSKDAPL